MCETLNLVPSVVTISLCSTGCDGDDWVWKPSLFFPKGILSTFFVATFMALSAPKAFSASAIVLPKRTARCLGVIFA